MTRIELPFPPSVNGMYKNVPGKGRVKSDGYAAWTTEALWKLKIQGAKPVKGEVSIWIGLVAPTKHAMDCSNRIKSVEDVLVKGGIIEDDSNKFVRRVSAEWLPEGPGCVVLIQPIADPVDAHNRTQDAYDDVLDAMWEAERKNEPGLWQIAGRLYLQYAKTRDEEIAR